MLAWVLCVVLLKLLSCGVGDGVDAYGRQSVGRALFGVSWLWHYLNVIHNVRMLVKRKKKKNDLDDGALYIVKNGSWFMIGILF